jgi:uncharacterized protein (UPF0332 family)
LTIDQEELLLHARKSLRGAHLGIKHRLWDSAVSYAYRAMYECAQDFLLEHEIAFSKHPETIAAFRELFCANGIVPTEYVQFLLEALPFRDEAFHQTSERLTEKSAKMHVERAEQFLALAEKLLGPVSNEE